MERVISIFDTIANWTGKTFSWLVLAMIGMTMYEVVSRFAFNKPTLWAHEMTTMVFAISVMMLGGYCLLTGQHVRVDLLWAQLSPRGRAVADVVTSVLAFLFVVVLVWYATPWAWHSFQISERTRSALGPVLFPVKMAIALGAFLLFLQLVGKLVRDLYKVTTRTPTN